MALDSQAHATVFPAAGGSDFAPLLRHCFHDYFSTNLPQRERQQPVACRCGTFCFGSRRNGRRPRRRLEKRSFRTTGCANCFLYRYAAAVVDFSDHPGMAAIPPAYSVRIFRFINYAGYHGAGAGILSGKPCLCQRNLHDHQFYSALFILPTQPNSNG